MEKKISKYLSSKIKISFIKITWIYSFQYNTKNIILFRGPKPKRNQKKMYKNRWNGQGNIKISFMKIILVYSFQCKT